MEIIELERLCHHEEACRAAHLASSVLIEKRMMNWQAAGWDSPAIVAMHDGKCVAGINYSIDEKQLIAHVDFAFCNGEHPSAFAACLLRARKKIAAAKLREVRFAMHRGNAPMEKLVRKLKLQPHSLSFRVPLAA